MAAALPVSYPVTMRFHVRHSDSVSGRRSLLLGAFVLSMTVPALAFAITHGALKRSIPANEARLTRAPRDLRLEFTEPPELAVATVELLAASGSNVALAPLSLAPESPRTIVVGIRGPLAEGVYTVAWKIAGKDGHPVRGRFRFTIVAGAAGLTTSSAPDADSVRRIDSVPLRPAPGQIAPPAEHHDPANFPESAEFGAESPAYVAVRWMQFTALLVVLGAVAFYYAVLGSLERSGTTAVPLAEARDRSASLGTWAASALGVVVVLRLYAQSLAMHGPAAVFDSGMIGTMLSRTVWGWGWLLQLSGVAVALTGFILARRGSRGHSRGWALAALGAVALAFAPGLSGHAASAPRLTLLAVLADGIHVLGAAGWLGSLLFVVWAGIPVALRLPEGERGTAVAQLVNAFSPTALVFAALAVATGTFAAWLHLESIPALWQTSYGRTLLLKLAILSVVAGTGAYNWRRVKPRLGDAVGTRRVVRSASVELAVAVIVLAVTAVLVATPPTMAQGMAVDGGQNAASLLKPLRQLR